jgi:hypothetical protein
MRDPIVSAVRRALIVAASVAIAGCEGNATGFLIDSSTTGAQVRVFNAVTGAGAVDFLIDGQVAASSIGYGAASGYRPVSLGAHTLQIRASNTGTSLLDLARDFSSAGRFSLIPASGLGTSGALLLTDDPNPVTGQGRVRVVHVAATPGAVSVYVTAPDADLASATPTVPALPFGTASNYLTLAPGTYRVRVTPVGNPAQVLLDSGNLSIGSGSVRSLMLTDAPGGGLPTTLSVVSDAT